MTICSASAIAPPQTRILHNSRERGRRQTTPAASSILILLTLLFATYGSSAAHAADSNDKDDPFEQTNRSVFVFDQALDKIIARPIATLYNRIVPECARDGVHNLLENLNSPVTFENDALQGQGRLAENTLSRAAINSSIGMGGLVDVATKAGIPEDVEDFGLTLGNWGVGDGPYLVLPILGPTNSRDLAGKVVDAFIDPLTYIRWPNANVFTELRAGMIILDLRARNIETLDQIERSPIDIYALTRNLYQQYRNAKIKHGGLDLNDLPDF